ncbi:hypothetical protein WA026_008454 [Henosepilachna vigintioctopunctata]|uniref:Ionotropic glutamate receptor C-terminal domain-containing protein n=1 Tax=Henosepilachna vigintioctopunctata TaxID=420089 RepID=A0AAW1UKM0_9CUCU
MGRPSISEYQLNIIDQKCKTFNNVMKKVSNQGLLKQPFKWVVFGNIENIEKLNIYPAVDSDFIVIQNISGEYTITTIHKASEIFSKFFHTKLASWNSKQEFHNYEVSSLFRNRRNLNGSLFPLAFWASDPNTYDNIEYYRFTHIDPSIRFTFKITELLTSMLNVNKTYLIHKVSYVTMIEDIRNGKAIIGATPIFVVKSRIAWADYLAPNTPSYMAFIFRAPPLSYISNIFIRPFQSYVWYASILAIIIISSFMYIILYWEWKETSFRSKIIQFPYATRPTTDYVTLIQMGIVSQQGSDTELKSISGRMIFLFSLLCFMFLYTAYSGMIVALLQSTSDTIISLNDVLASGMELGVENLSYAVPYFKQANDIVKKKIYIEKLKSKGEKFLMPLNEGMEKMRTEFFAFHTELASAYKVVSDTFQESEKCKFREISYINIVEPYITATKNHSYKDIMKIGYSVRLFWLNELGFYNCERRRIFYERPKCSGEISSFVSAGLIDTYGAFLFFGIGILLSLGIFLMEHILNRYIGKNR